MPRKKPSKKPSKKPPKPFYNCDRCPAYCCSYPRIIVGKRDLTRLAKHFEIGEDAAREKYTKRGFLAGNFKSGNEKVIGWFVGQVMKATGGKANPGLVNQILKKKLG